MSQIYFLNAKQADIFIKEQNQKGCYVESVKRYLDPKSLKAATGLTSMTGISDVWADDEPNTREHPHHLISYNAEYQAHWGDQPLYGNIFVIVSKKVWDALPADKRKTDDEVKTLTLQPAEEAEEIPRAIRGWMESLTPAGRAALLVRLKEMKKEVKKEVKKH
jgi:hypothetical protein